MRDERFGHLSQREREVFSLIVEGHTNPQIAEVLRISVKTVEKHRSGALFKLGLHDRCGLVKLAFRLGLLRLVPRQIDAHVTDLTPREREIFARIVDGYTNREIAERLVVSIKTVESHRLNLMRKLRAHDGADLVRIALCLVGDPAVTYAHRGRARRSEELPYVPTAGRTTPSARLSRRSLTRSAADRE
jgi:DNA-binding NarL/FixJ family response regulator